MQGADLWTVYGKSLQRIDCCKRRFTAMFNRVKVFETAIARTLQSAGCALSDSMESRVSTDVGSRPTDAAVVVLSCSLDDDIVDAMTATQLRAVLVAQHLHSLLANSPRSVTAIAHQHHCSYF